MVQLLNHMANRSEEIAFLIDVWAILQHDSLIVQPFSDPIQNLNSGVFIVNKLIFKAVLKSLDP
jgi:hypothetical protein